MKDQVCENCGKKGHWKQDCWAPVGGAQNNKGVGKNKRTEVNKGNGKGSKTSNSKTDFVAVCHRCGKPGHRAAECRAAMPKCGKKVSQNVHSLEDGGYTEPEGELSGLSMDLCAVSPEHYLPLMSIDEQSQPKWRVTEATIDSGAATSVAPMDMFPEVPVRPLQKSQQGISFKTASGGKIAHLGNSVIDVATESGLNRRITCAATGLKTILLAVSKLYKTGHNVEFTATGGWITNTTHSSRIPMYVQNGVYIFKLWVKSNAMNDDDVWNKDLAILCSGGRGQAGRP